MSRLVNPVTSHESVTVASPVVEATARGAGVLAEEYWGEVKTTTRGLVRPTVTEGSIALRLFGRGPALIRLGRPSISADAESVTCRYPIVGGLLVGREGGSLALEQVSGDTVLLRSTLTEYVPRLAGVIYFQVQARLHSLISRRYFARLERSTR